MDSGTTNLRLPKKVFQAAVKAIEAASSVSPDTLYSRPLSLLCFHFWFYWILEIIDSMKEYIIFNCSISWLFHNTLLPFIEQICLFCMLGMEVSASFWLCSQDTPRPTKHTAAAGRDCVMCFYWHSENVIYICHCQEAGSQLRCFICARESKSIYTNKLGNNQNITTTLYIKWGI